MVSPGTIPANTDLWSWCSMTPLKVVSGSRMESWPAVDWNTDRHQFRKALCDMKWLWTLDFTAKETLNVLFSFYPVDPLRQICFWEKITWGFLEKYILHPGDKEGDKLKARTRIQTKGGTLQHPSGIPAPGLCRMRLPSAHKGSMWSSRSPWSKSFQYQNHSLQTHGFHGCWVNGGHPSL